ncbi:NADPH-dependent FMN reductase [Mammaliicoccus sciuri]|uniref:NADPH-dependent FMN reductase domain protein n=1 Tax=Sporosarcina newyorkensis 2681 TaxID=1027292 RepID=F9DVH2_9BACL|nr:NADPH-dependent FMN reductase [Sporosarcina newyorkensis]EGQ22600.1 NADPH-dependent FMN reductase domain protein [Sporosarcina newyorkensis 2681]
MTIKVKAIIGSTSSTSYNLKLVNYMAKRYQDELEIVPVLINDLEMFSIDIESDPSPAVRAFKEDVKDSDAVLFAAPEYNYSIPGAMKNAIDWLSRGGDFTLHGKTGFIVGASMGVLGTVRAQIHLREILSNPALAPTLLPGNDVFIGAVHTKMNEEGDLTDEATIQFLDTVVQNFIAFYKKQKAVSLA